MKTILILLLGLVALKKPSILSKYIQDKYGAKRVKNGNRKVFLTEEDVGMFNYSLINADTGNFVDGNMNEEPITVQLIGNDTMIKCIKELLTYMSEGEYIRAFCKPDTAYGDKPKEEVPPNTILGLELKLVKVIKKNNLGGDYDNYLDQKRKEREINRIKSEL